ncbi:MAG TPA: hypothetical protein VKP30_00500 [Polyangiaceae bacterium]|nr:hypothetical protein [Polyangiaceae bacterium]
MTELGDPISRNQSGLRRAFKKVRPLLDAMPDSALLPLNLEPLAAVAKVRAVLPAILLMRDSIEGDLKLFDFVNLDQLETYALALLQAHAIYLGISARSQVLPKLSAEASALRGQLLRDCNTLVERGLIPRARLSKLQGPNGYRNIATDLLTIGELLRDSWPAIANRTAISLNELDRASALADEMINALGQRKKVTVLAAEAALTRQRAFSLLINAYNEVRQAVLYVRRHEGDAAQIAPSLYKKGTRRRKKREQDAFPATPPSPNADAPPGPASVRDKLSRASAKGADNKNTGTGGPESDPFLN